MLFILNSLFQHSLSPRKYIFLIVFFFFLGLLSTISQSLAINLEDEDLFIYLEYPNDWTVEKVSYSLEFTPPEVDYKVFSIERVSGLEGYSLGDFVTEQIANLEFEIGDAPRYTIGEPVEDGVGGVEALTVFYAYTSTLDDSTYGGYRTFVINDNSGYVIDYHTDNEQLRDYFTSKVHTILESIVFLDQSNFVPNEVNGENRGAEERDEEQETMILVPRTCFGPQGSYTCMKFEAKNTIE